MNHSAVGEPRASEKPTKPESLKAGDEARWRDFTNQARVFWTLEKLALVGCDSRKRICGNGHRRDYRKSSPAIGFGSRQRAPRPLVFMGLVVAVRRT